MDQSSDQSINQSINQSTQWSTISYIYIVNLARNATYFDPLFQALEVIYNQFHFFFAEMADDVSEITDYLCVSGVNSVNMETLRRHKITCVINTAAEISPMKSEDLCGLEYMYVPLRDENDEKLVRNLDTCVAKIHTVRHRGGKTLVHCLCGRSRSVSVCVAYLIKYGGLTCKEAIKKIRNVRPEADPNSGFWKQLCEYERFIDHHTVGHIVHVS